MIYGIIIINTSQALFCVGITTANVTFLPPLVQLQKESSYVETVSYFAQQPDEISLPQGTVVHVMKKSVVGC